jgi:WD40 repeat protein
LELVGDGKKSNRNAIGARVAIDYAGRRQVRFVNGGGNPRFRMFGNRSGMAFSADAKTLFLSDHAGLLFWDLADPKATQPRMVRPENFFFHNAPVALAPDGKTAAAMSMMGGDQDMAVRFFDTLTGMEARQIENDQPIQGLCFSPDGRLLAVATQQRIELWDVANGDEVRVFPAAPNTFYQLLTFSPDGKMLAAIGNPNRFPVPEDSAVEIHLWETASGKERACLRLPSPLPPARNPRMFYPNRGINGLAFSVDGRFLAASGSDSAVHMWDL